MRKYFTNLSETHKQWHQWAFETTFQIKTENIQWKENGIFREDNEVQKREPIDSFIDHLIKGQETKLLKCYKEIDAKTALKLDYYLVGFWICAEISGFSSFLLIQLN